MILSIIILAHNKSDLTLSCLNAIARSQVPKPFETLIIDNASNPPLESILDKTVLHATKAKIIRNDQNLSFSKANNKAVELSCGKFLLFLNNDVIIYPNTISLLFENSIPKSIVGGKLLFPKSNLFQHAGISHMLWGKASNYGVGAKSEHPKLNTRRNRFAVTGAMQFVRRDFFFELEGYDEKYHWGYEDVDLCLKARHANADIIYEPRATGTHVESATLSTVRLTDKDLENYNYYRKKWDFELQPAEDNYIDSLIENNIRVVGIFGTGGAAISLFHKLSKTDIETICFILDRKTNETPKLISNIPVLDLNKSCKLPLDLIIIGSQFHYNIYPRISNFFSKEIILHPVVIE